MNSSVLIVYQGSPSDLRTSIQELRQATPDLDRFPVVTRDWASVHTHRKPVDQKAYLLALQAKLDGFKGIVLLVDPELSDLSRIESAIEQVRSEQAFPVVLGFTGRPVSDWPAKDREEWGKLFAPGSGESVVRSRATEEAFWRQLGAERHRYAGRWVVLEGPEIVASGFEASDVVRRARKKGVDVPYMFFVPETDTEQIHGGRG